MTTVSLEEAEKGFKFVVHAIYWFSNGDFRTKRDLLRTLGSNFLMKDGKLSLAAHPWLTSVKEECKPLEEEYLTLEPAERCLKTGTNDRIVSIRTRWLGR